jgi:hypothetical protein
MSNRAGSSVSLVVLTILFEPAAAQSPAPNERREDDRHLRSHSNERYDQ